MKNILKKIEFWLILIMFVAIFLRIYGINWGLPSKDYYFSYHSDEVHYIRGLSLMEPRKLNFNPHFFNWGTWHYFELGITIGIASLFDVVKLVKAKEFYYSYPLELAKIYLTGRLLSLLFAIATIYLLYLIGKRFYRNNKIALLAAFFMAINPAHILHSHYLKADTSVTFWVTALLFFSFYLLENGRLRYYVLSGIMGGLAIGAQQNGICFLLTILFAHLLREYKSFKDIKSYLLSRKLLIGYLSIALTYLIVSPYLYLSPAEFMLGVRRVIFRQGGGIDFVVRTNLLFDTFKAFNVALTAFFTFAGFAGIVYSIFSRSRKNLLIFFWLLPYATLIIAMASLNTRHQMLIFPGLLLLAAVFINFLFSIMIKKSRKLILTIFISFFSLYAIIYSLAYDKELSVKSIQKEASEWLLSNVPPGSVIAVARNPEIRNCPTIIHQDYYYKEKAVYKVINLDYNINYLGQQNPDYFIITKREGFCETGRCNAVNADFIGAIKKDYSVIKKFQRIASIFNMHFQPSISISDWEITFPVIYVLKRAN